MDNNLFFILLLFTMGKNSNNSKFNVDSLSNFIGTMELDDQYTLEKIKIAGEIGPYLPENYIPLLNRSISITNNLIRINKVRDSLKIKEENYISKHIPMDNNKDRLNKILSIVQRESPNSKINKSGTVLDIILNMDKYKKTFEVLNKFMSSDQNINDPSQLINLIGPLMGGDEKDNSNKLKEITKVMDMMKLLDNPKKKPAEN